MNVNPRKISGKYFTEGFLFVIYRQKKHKMCREYKTEWQPFTMAMKDTTNVAMCNLKEKLNSRIQM